MPVPLKAIRFQNDLVVSDLGLGRIVWAGNQKVMPVAAPTTERQFNGVATGPPGALYVTGDKTNVIYRIWPR